ncbi:MAG: AI-2E family transporter, partial [Candidatus Woesearchaeota archaeon]
MPPRDKKPIADYLKYFFLALFFFVIYITYLFVKPFIVTTVSGALIAFAFYPLYKWLHRKITSKSISALIVSLIILLLMLLPVVLLADDVAKESRFIYLRVKQRLASENVLGLKCDTDEGLLCSLNRLLGEPEVKAYVQEIIGKGASYVVINMSKLILSLPQIFLQLFVLFFVVFYFLVEGDVFIEKLKKILPLARHHREQIFEKISSMTSAVLYGSIVVALLQGLLGGIGFLIFKAGSPIIWGLVMTIFSLVPFVGTAAIWVPAGINLIVSGNQANGIGLLIYGTLIISS